MYIVKSGILQIFLEDNSKVIVLGHQFPGELLGELEVVHYDNHRLASVSAIEESSVWMIHKTELEELFDRYPVLLRRLFYTVSERLRQANIKISYLAFFDTKLRITNLLLDLGTNFGREEKGGILIDWSLTHQQVAQMVGVNRESASRVLQDLQREGVIRIESRRIRILQPHLLSSIGHGSTDINQGTRHLIENRMSKIDVTSIETY